VIPNSSSGRSLSVTTPEDNFLTRVRPADTLSFTGVNGIEVSGSRSQNEITIEIAAPTGLDGPAGSDGSNGLAGTVIVMGSTGLFFENTGTVELNDTYEPAQLYSGNVGTNGSTTFFSVAFSVTTASSNNTLTIEVKDANGPLFTIIYSFVNIIPTHEGNPSHISFSFVNVITTNPVTITADITGASDVEGVVGNMTLNNFTFSTISTVP